MSSTRAQWSGGWQLTVGGRWQHVAVVDTGCRCRPRRPRLQSFLRPSHPSSSSGSTGTYSSYSSSNRANDSASADVYKDHQQPYGVTAKASAPVATKKVVSKQVKKGCEKLTAAAEEVEDEEEDVGVAVEKESSDPRADFHDSMVQMVVEMGLCDWDGLRSMLRRLLALNAPRHHAAILAAFAEVFAQLASESPAPPPPAYQYTSDE